MSPFLSLTSVDLDRLCGIIISTPKSAVSPFRALSTFAPKRAPLRARIPLDEKTRFCERGARSEERGASGKIDVEC